MRVAFSDVALHALRMLFFGQASSWLKHQAGLGKRLPQLAARKPHATNDVHKQIVTRLATPKATDLCAVHTAHLLQQQTNTRHRPSHIISYANFANSSVTATRDLNASQHMLE